MSDLIITPSSGKIDFIYQSGPVGQEGQTSRLESIIIDPIDGLVFSGKISASSVNSPLNITATSSNINYPFIFASSGETGAKSLLMDSAGGTYNPSTNLATVNITGTSSWATNAVTNANLTGDVTSVGNATTIANSVVTNAKLANSSVTIGSTAISLGAAGAQTTIVGLVSVTSTTFVGDLTGTATTASYANALNAANRYTVVGITGSLFGTSSWATNATNALQLGGTAAASYVTLTGAQNLSDKTITGTFTGNLTGTATTASYANALNAANSYTIAGLTVNGNFAVNGSLTVFSASNVYITSSNLVVTDNIITMNALSPYQRYAGIQMYDTGSGTLSNFLWDGDGDYFFLSGSSVNGKIITGPDSQANLSANFVPKATAGYKLGNSIIYDDGTNVGIGTTIPGRKLHLYAPQSAIKLSNTGTGAWSGFEWSVGNGAYTAYSGLLDDTGRYFIDVGSNGDDFTILQNGSIGIGIISPIEKLHVLGNIHIQSESDSLGGGGLYLGISNSRNIAIRQTSTNKNFAVDTFNTSESWQNRITILNSGGNVGIGTTSPAAKLQVNSTTAGATLLRTDGTNGTLFSVVDDLSDSLMSVNNSAGLPVLEVFADDRLVAGQYGQNDFVVVNNKVGIGTNNPSFKLDVTGSLGINASSLDTNWPFVVSDNSSAGSRYGLNKAGSMGFNNADNYAQLQLVGTNGAYLDLTNSVGGDSNARLIYYAGSRLELTYGFTTTITLNSTGVGIGTTVPSSLLHVYSTSAEPAIRLTSTSGSAKTYGLVCNTPWAPGSFHIYDYTADSTRIHISSNGNVGIGVGAASPASLLTVQSNGTQLRLQTTSGPTSYFSNIGSRYDSSHPFTIEVANGAATATEYFGIYADGGGANNRIALLNGNVGIGTTTASAKLHVAGNISGSSFTSSISNAVGFLGTSSWASNATNALQLGGVVAASYVTLNDTQSLTNKTITGTFTGNLTGTATTASYANALNAANSYTVVGITGNLTGNVTGTATTASYANALNAANSYTVTGITGALTGTSSWATNATNALQLGGTAATSYVTLTGTQTLTGKTITGTFTGNLTGTASWASNAVTALNGGVTSVSGTANQVIVSGNTGAVTFSLPQSIHTTATPTFTSVSATTFTGDLTGTATTASYANALNAANNYTVNSLTEGGYLAYPLREYVINFSALSATNFYPVAINNPPGTDATWHNQFSVDMVNQSGDAAYNVHSMYGEVRGQGWTDQNQFYRVFHTFYTSAERSILGVWRGTQTFYGVVVYLRGGKNYYVRTTSRSVVGYSAAQTLGSSVFAIKNAAGADVSGTSANIGEMLNLINNPSGFYHSDNAYIGTDTVLNLATTSAPNLSIGGTAATATNSTQLGGVAAASYVTLANTQSLTNKTITGTFTGNLTGTSSWASNAVTSLACTGNAATVTNGVYTTGNQSIAGTKTFTGVTSFSNTSDYQIVLDGSGGTWAGINWSDVNGVDVMWFNGQNKTFAIGGGGSNVSGKKLHVDGGVTIGADYDATVVPSNGLSIQGGVQIGNYSTYVINALGASGTQSRTFEIARLGIDYNDWNNIGTFEVEIHEKYYSQGLKKVYNIWYGYPSNSGIRLVELRGTGANSFQCRIGSQVQISGDSYYLPVFIDVTYYSSVDVVIKTNRNITTTTNPEIGYTYINIVPTPTNISNFTADSDLEISTLASAKLGGNTILTTATTSATGLSIGGTAATASYANALNPANSYTVTNLTASGVGKFFGNIAIITDASANDYSLIGHSYAGTTKAFTGYNGGSAIYGGESTIPTRIQAGGQYVISVLANGNVGIGTTSPLSKLHISGSGQTIMRLDSDTTTNVSQFQIKAASSAVIIMGMFGGSATGNNFGVTAAGQAYFGTSTLGSPHPTSLVIGNASNIPIAFSTNDVERMRIDGTGLVGIGTTVPSTLLHAYGSDGRYFTYSGTSGAFTIQRNAITTGGATPVLSLINTQGMDSSTGRGTSIQLDLGYGGSASVVGTAARGARIATLGETVYDATAANQNAVLAFFTSTAGSLTEKLRIRSDGSLSPITVSSTTAAATLLRADGTNGTLFSVVDDLSDSLMSVNNSAGLPVLEVFADDRIVAGQYGQNDFVVVNNKVGIGTNNPLAELHVTSSTSIPSAIFMGGNVGIGLTLPTAPLHVNGVISGSSFTGAGTGLTGTAAGLSIGGTAATVTTNANLTGHITSTGNATILGSFTSAQLLAALTDETGTGANVFATSPTLVSPALGTPTSGVLTNCTGTAAGLTAGAVTNGVYTTGAQSIGGVKSFTSTMNVTGVRETMTTVAAAANVAINLNLGTIFKLTFSSTVSTFTITNTENTNVAAGNSFTLISAPDNSNAKTIAFSFITNGAAATAVKWAGNITPTATITSGKFDVFSFIYDGTNWYGFLGGLNY